MDTFNNNEILKVKMKPIIKLMNQPMMNQHIMIP